MTGKGTWTRYPKIRRHPRFAEFATYLGQDHTGPVATFPVAAFDIDELWSMVVRCDRLINGVDSMAREP